MDLDFSVRTEENEKRCKEVLSIFLNAEYKDFKKVFNTLEMVYRCIGYEKISSVDEEVSNIIIHSECVDYRKNLKKSVK